MLGSADCFPLPVLAAVSQSCSPGYSRTFYKESRFYYVEVISFFWTRAAWQVAVVFVAKVDWASTCAAGLFLSEGLLIPTLLSCVYVCVGTCTCYSVLMGVASLPPVGTRGSNSSCQSWWWTFLLIGPSCRLGSAFLSFMGLKLPYRLADKMFPSFSSSPGVLCLPK